MERAGVESSQKALGFRFACSLAAQTASSLGDVGSSGIDRRMNPVSVLAVRRFATGALSLGEDMFGVAIHCLKEAIAEAMPSWTHWVGGSVELTTPVKKAIASIVSETPAFTAAQRAALIDSL